MEPSRFGLCPLGGAHEVRLTCDQRSVACPRCHKTWTLNERGDLIPTLEPTHDQ